jgi:MFS family permease
MAAAEPSVAPRPLYALPFRLALLELVLTYWTIDIVGPALPDIQEDLGLSAAATSAIWSLLFLGRLLGNFPAAWLLAQIGTAGTGVLGGVVLGAGTAAAAAAPSELVLYPARVVQGVGIALLVNACLRAVLGARPGRGAAMTYFTFAATVGGVVGLQSGGYLTGASGWRSVFILSLVVSVVLTMATLTARLNAVRVDGATDPLPRVSDAEPVSNRVVALPLIFNFLVFFNYSMWVALPLYTEHEFDASPGANARLLMVITVVHLVGAFPGGRLIRAFGAQRVLVGAMLLAMAGTFLVYPMGSLVWIAAPLVLYGFGQVVATSAGGDLVLHLGQQSPRSIGLVRFTSDLGLVVGPYLTGALSDRYGYASPFIALPVIMLAASLLALRQAITAGDRSV